jgi:hypothetical protein
MATARRLGVKTVAVYSEADRHAAHVQVGQKQLAVFDPCMITHLWRKQKRYLLASFCGASCTGRAAQLQTSVRHCNCVRKDMCCGINTATSNPTIVWQPTRDVNATSFIK